MGCGGSTEKTSPSVYGKQELSVYDRKPKISIRIGTNVKKLDSKPRVIFIFGTGGWELRTGAPETTHIELGGPFLAGQV
ncbi:hypothetical protein LSH36_449g04021 [Paralvinella palmiformis]|uniref:Uncharacterized protein n=1 Tax=Paralvinella palmiformis TaxID=53620 RepID=A0AAD9JAH2_9ANNE|nr:hypothetical protein LSH36_449g04021 [Paralvinella palmiformis]